jgi:amino acid transporter
MSNNSAPSGTLERFGYEESFKRTLSLGSLVFYGLAYLAPMSIFSVYGLVDVMTHGMVAISYAIATLAMVFTAYSYGRMAAAYPIAGSVYSYTQHAINPYIGFLGGWSILMDYLLLPMLNCLLISLFLTPYFPNVPGWVWILVYVGLSTLINFFGINVTAWVNNLVIMAQLVFVVAFVVFIAKWLLTGNGSATFFDYNALFNSSELKEIGGFGTLVSGGSILALCFLGFDAISTVTEEAKDPEKNIGRAIMITCIGAGLLFIVLSYLMQLAWPMGWNEFKVADTGAQEMIVLVAGSAMSYLFIGIYAVGGIACTVAAQASAARILFGMGRDGALPKKFFGYVHPKYKVPTLNIFLLAAICLTSIFMSLSVAVSLVNFGALTGFVLVNLCVIMHYYIKGKKRGGLNVFRYLIAPLIGMAVCATLWWGLDINSKILGFSWLAVGIVYLAFLTKFFRELPPDMSMQE